MTNKFWLNRIMDEWPSCTFCPFWLHASCSSASAHPPPPTPWRHLWPGLAPRYTTNRTRPHPRGSLRGFLGDLTSPVPHGAPSLGLPPPQVTFPPLPVFPGGLGLTGGSDCSWEVLKDLDQIRLPPGGGVEDPINLWPGSVCLHSRV